MRLVIFENQNAIFDFGFQDAIERLKHYSEQGVQEGNEILEVISSSPSSTVRVTSDYFAFVVLDLVKAGRDHVYCKACKATYDSGQLISIPLGRGSFRGRKP